MSITHLEILVSLLVRKFSSLLKSKKQSIRKHKPPFQILPYSNSRYIYFSLKIRDFFPKQKLRDDLIKSAVI